MTRNDGGGRTDDRTSPVTTTHGAFLPVTMAAAALRIAVNVFPMPIPSSSILSCNRDLTMASSRAHIIQSGVAPGR